MSVFTQHAENEHGHIRVVVNWKRLFSAQKGTGYYKTYLRGHINTSCR